MAFCNRHCAIPATLAQKGSYERLEFLGDRVLGLLLADHFYVAFPDDDEGTLSLRLHGEARMSTLADVARALSLADYIQSQTGLDIASNDSVMADVVESIMAAIYLDSGLDAAKAFLERHWPLMAMLFHVMKKTQNHAFRNGACNVVSGYPNIVRSQKMVLIMPRK